MNFENKLISGQFIKRYKRFFVDVKLMIKLLQLTVLILGQCMVY